MQVPAAGKRYYEEKGSPHNTQGASIRRRKFVGYSALCSVFCGETNLVSNLAGASLSCLMFDDEISNITLKFSSEWKPIFKFACRIILDRTEIDVKKQYEYPHLCVVARAAKGGRTTAHLSPVQLSGRITARANLGVRRKNWKLICSPRSQFLLSPLLAACVKVFS